MTAFIINPNCTVAMTTSMLAAAREAAPQLSWEGWTSHDGPPAIQGAEDGQRASAPLLKRIQEAEVAGATGIAIGCFDDTALDEAAQSTRIPVIGIGQAAFHHCALRNRRFSVVTTLSVSVPVIDENIRRYGLGGYLGKVRASDVPVLALEENPTKAIEPILHETEAAIVEDGAEAVVLGCAGMVTVVRALREAVSIPIIDPVEAAAGCLAWVMRP